MSFQVTKGPFNITFGEELPREYPLYKVIPGAKNFIAERTGRVLTSEQIDAVRNGRQR